MMLKEIRDYRKDRGKNRSSGYLKDGSDRLEC